MTNYYEQEVLWDRELLPQERERMHIVRAIWPDDVHTVLDVGCGSGAISNYLPDHLDITGLDFSAKALQHFRHKKVLGNAASLPFEDDAFDLVICSDVLEHLKYVEFESAVKEMQRVAKSYILIISPNEEQLEHHQTRCWHCHTIFHVNWHIRSLTVDLVESIFRDSFAIDFYTYFAGWWAQPSWLSTQADHMEQQFHYWDKALCPLCGAVQDHPPAARSEPVLRPYLQKRLDLRPHVVPVEMLVLFKLRGKVTLRDNTQLQRHKIPGTLVLHTQQPQPYPFIHLEIRNRCTIYPASPLNTSEDICACPRGYALINSNTSWGEIAHINGRSVRYCQNEKGQQAVFIMPHETRYGELCIEYVDLTDAEILVQVYDVERGYIHLGKLGNQGSKEWRTDRFTIPPEIRNPDYGMLFHLVPTTINPRGNLAIWRIYMQGDSILTEPATQYIEDALAIVPLPSGGALAVYEGTRSLSLAFDAELVATMPDIVQGAYWVDGQGRWLWLGCSREIAIPKLHPCPAPSENRESMREILKELIER